MPTACGSAFAIGQLTLSDGSEKYTYADGSFEICGVEGEYYNEDQAGNWNWQGVDGSKCSGSPSGGWYCSMAGGQQYSGGDWSGSPAAKSKQRAAAAKAATPAPTPTPTPTPTTAPATKPATPPAVPDPNDKIIDTSPPDAQGGITYTFQSGASYYQTPDGAFTYIGADGYKQWGDAQGNICDSYGYCWGPGYDSSGGIGSFFSNLGSTGQAVLIGGAVLVLAVVLGGRRR